MFLFIACTEKRRNDILNLMLRFFSALFFLLFCQTVLAIDGVDLSLGYANGSLDFTSVSGNQRSFKGVGSELGIVFPLYEQKKFRLGLALNSRIMSWTANGLASNEYDDIQTFSLCPGIEIKYSYFFLQVLQQTMNVNNYFVSGSASKGTQFSLTGPYATAGFNYRFANLGIGASYSQMNYKVPANKLDFASGSSDSDYVEKSYSINLTYYFSMKSGKFLKGLFVNEKN